MADLAASVRKAWSQVEPRVAGARQRAGKLFMSASERAQLVREDVRRRVRDLAQQLEIRRQKALRTADGAIQRAIRHIPLFSRRDLEELRHQVEGVSARLDELEKRRPVENKEGHQAA